MIWCAISENDIIEPYLFKNGLVNGDSYENMLRFFFLLGYETIPKICFFRKLSVGLIMPTKLASNLIENVETIGLEQVELCVAATHPRTQLLLLILVRVYCNEDIF